MRPFVADCHLGLGNLYRPTGNEAQAEEHLAVATTMYREMGMTYCWRGRRKKGSTWGDRVSLQWRQRFVPAL